MPDAPAHGPGHVHHGPEHPQPAVQPKHAAADRPRPADPHHPGRRHLGAGSTGTGDLLTNDSTSQFHVTFDRPIQTSTFTASQVVSIMGPAGSILGPQTFSSTSVDQAIPAATTAGVPARSTRR